MRYEARPAAAAEAGQEVICGFCGAATPVRDPASCVRCGASVRVLEPLVVECGWCGSSNRRDQRESCAHCGGPLPALPTGNPGPRPPDPPRVLPAGYANRIRYWKNVEVLIGIVFTIPFFWTLLFPAVGIPLWIMGARRARRQLDALMRGTATRGRITGISVDDSKSINEKHPWKIAYTFDTPAASLAGACEAWDPVSARRSAGDVLWVVYDPADPASNSIWPPIR